jgi:hypothetical protein
MKPIARTLACLLYVMLVGAEKSDDGFTPLFNGKDFTGWQGSKGGWTFEPDGVLAWKEKAGDIWTEKQYADFVLEFDYKVAKGSNSGVFIRAGNPRDPVQTALEVQVYDSHGKGRGLHHSGAVYDAMAPSKNVEKPAGEWNHMTILANGPVIQVTLNGEQVIDMNLDRWTVAGKNPDGSDNKFRKALKDFPRRGHVQIQDHHKPVWYRNMKIRELKAQA